MTDFGSEAIIVPDPAQMAGNGLRLRSIPPIPPFEMRASSTVLTVFLLALLAIAVTARIWIGMRIDAAMVATALCLDRQEKARLLDAGTPRQRDLIVVKAAQFAASDRSPPHPRWLLEGIAIDWGFATLWTPRQRLAIFRKLVPHLRSCPAGLH